MSWQLQVAFWAAVGAISGVMVSYWLPRWVLDLRERRRSEPSDGDWLRDTVQRNRTLAQKAEDIPPRGPAEPTQAWPYQPMGKHAWTGDVVTGAVPTVGPPE